MRLLIPTLLVTATLTGCVTVDIDAPPMTRAQIARTLDLSEFGVNIMLGYAEAQGQDVAEARKIIMASFGLVRSLLVADFHDTTAESLHDALASLRSAGDSAIVLCRAAGVDTSRVEQRMGEAYLMLERLARWLS
jgi:hypothetical protein